MGAHVMTVRVCAMTSRTVQCGCAGVVYRVELLLWPHGQQLRDACRMPSSSRHVYRQLALLRGHHGVSTRFHETRDDVCVPVASSKMKW